MRPHAMGAALAALAGLVPAGALAQAAGRDGYYGHMWDGGGGMGFGFYGIGMLLVFWGLVIFMLVIAVRWLMEQGRGGGKGDAALDILKQRLAKGEIDPEEYSARKKALES